MLPHRLSVLAAVLLLSPALRAQQSPASASPPRTAVAVTGVTVIDVAQGRRVPDQTVVVQGTRIVSVGPRARARVPVGARLVDGRGRYLIPGLSDMHVHIREIPGRYLPLLLAHGVTSARDMHQPLGLDSLRAWRREIDDGRRAGPRLVFAGPLVDGPGSQLAGAVIAATPDEGRRAVDSLRSAGADFIKVYALLRPGVYAAIAARARQLTVPFAGHSPILVGLAEASDAGQRSIEHLAEAEWRLGCSSRAAELRAERGVSPQRPGSEWTRALVASEDSAHCAALDARLARNGTWAVPTLVNAAVRELPALARAHAARWRWVPDSVRVRFDSVTRGAVPGDTIVRSNPHMRWALATVARLRGAGVPLLAGTDCTTARVNVCGPALHDELALLVAAGLTPADALRAATLAPARFLNAADTMGTVATGRVADLVLLDADPLMDIRNAARIRAVVAAGRLFERAALDGLLADAARAARQPAAPRQR